jgi:TPR repeat protein
VLRAVIARIASTVLVFSFAFALSPAHADIRAGISAYSEGDYETAYREWLSLAENGNPVAQYNLSLLYRHGKSRPIDLQTAASWCLKAANGGFARAQYEIAGMYEAGQGVDKNVIEAHKWYSLAAGQRYEDAKKRKKKLAKTMTPEEIALAEMWAREWKKARNAGSPNE